MQALMITALLSVICVAAAAAAVAAAAAAAAHMCVGEDKAVRLEEISGCQVSQDGDKQNSGRY